MLIINDGELRIISVLGRQVDFSFADKHVKQVRLSFKCVHNYIRCLCAAITPSPLVAME